MTDHNEQFHQSFQTVTEERGEEGEEGRGGEEEERGEEGEEGRGGEEQCHYQHVLDRAQTAVCGGRGSLSLSAPPQGGGPHTRHTHSYHQQKHPFLPSPDTPALTLKHRTHPFLPHQCPVLTQGKSAHIVCVTSEFHL